MDVAISVATPRAARALVELRTEVAQQMTREFGQGPWSACPSLADVRRQLRASRVLVANRGDAIIGTVRLVRALPWAIDSAAFTPAGTALYVLGLAVSPQARGQGVGRALIEGARQVARDWPANALWLDAYRHAAGAGRFYEKCGFRAVGPSARGEIPLIFYEWTSSSASSASSRT